MAIVVIILDQMTKWWILTSVMTPPRRIPVTGIFDLVLVYNRGVSFGLLGGAPSWATAALIVFPEPVAALIKNLLSFFFIISQLRALLIAEFCHGRSFKDI